jgi:hypothetical protein
VTMEKERSRPDAIDDDGTEALSCMVLYYLYAPRNGLVKMSASTVGVELQPSDPVSYSHKS